LDFEVQLHPEAPKVIATDGQRLQQILNNLLSNAFKFTERGSVTVRIEPAKPERIKELLPVQEDEAVIAISVTDTGIGIPIDKQQVIFEAFRQVDGTTNRQYGGTGLGLSICREFTRLLGGSIVVRSELHKGSTFTLYIPSRRETDSQGGTMADEASAASFAEVAVTRDSQEEASYAQENEEEDGVGSDVQLFKGKKVLLVDDDSRNVFALVSALEKKGVSVMAAEHGKRALEILEEQPGFDLVLMDIMMPVMDGYETMEAIRCRLGLTKLPIIALTAKAMKNERDKCREAGASDYIMKPLNIDQLFSLMRVWLTKQVNPF
jgi:two-component system chemotaxis sensor kinase CheA